MKLWADFRRPPAPPFDPAQEQQGVTEAVLRGAALLLRDERPAQEILAGHCARLTAQVPHLVLAWVWFGPPDTDVIEPQVVAGPAAAYAQALVIRRNLLTRTGPAFRTLSGCRLAPFKVTPNSLFGPWREAARQHGVRSVLSLPLSAGDNSTHRGLLVLYADVSGYFEGVGVGVFDAVAQLFGAVLSRSERDLALRRSAHCDALTGLTNRQGLALLEPELRRQTADDPPCAVLVVDIDHFKRVNDTYGHGAGDRVLRAVSAALRATVRGSDIVARWGGEEFVICLARMAPDTALVLAEKLRQQVAELPMALGGGGVVRVTISVGLTALQPGESLSDAVDRADAALYAAKRAGRNRVVEVGTGATAALA